MSLVEMIAEWKQGCSHAPGRRPEDCAACTRAVVERMVKKVNLAKLELAGVSR